MTANRLYKVADCFAAAHRPCVKCARFAVQTIVVYAACAIGSAGADEILRRSEKPVRGTFSAMTPTEITVKPSVGAVIRVPVGEIVRVKFAGEPPRLDSGRNAEANGLLDRAMDIYTQSKESYTGANANVKADLDYLIARVTAPVALSDPTKTDAAIRQLEAYQSANPQSFRLYESLYFLGRLYTAGNDGAKAREVFSKLAGAPLKLKDYRMAAKIAEGRLLLQERDVAGALAAFESVAGTNPSSPAEKSRLLEAMLGKATCLQRQNDYAAAISTLESVLKETPARETRVQAEAWLRKGDCFQEQKQIKEALLAYLHVDVLFAGEKTLHAEALYHLARLWGPAGHRNRADEAGVRLISDYPNSEWAKKLDAGG